MIPHLDDDAIEHATRIFLLGMGRLCARRTPDRPNRVPTFDSLNAVDRDMMLSVVAHTVKAANTFRQASTSDSTVADTESVSPELVS